MTKATNRPMTTEGAVGAMVRDFVLRATGNDEETADLCARLLEEERANSSICIELSPAEAARLRGKRPLVSEAPDASGLFIISQNGRLLYTRRNWCYETAVAERVKKMVRVRYDGEIEIPEDDAFRDLNALQRDAVIRMNRHQFTIVTGGPGTGKTYTIARAVKLIRDRNPQIRLGLAAPTGKAAARMNEAMQSQAQLLRLQEIPTAVTLHSLLHPNYNDLVTFRHNRANPLPLDWLIVDEASMVELPLMAKILDALPESCRLTLVGDANQLSSVGSGQIFGDLCRLDIVNAGSCKCELRESKRFPPDGEIAKLADAINRGDWQDALALLDHPDNRKIHYTRLDDTDAPSEGGNFTNTVERLFDSFCRQTDARGALEALNDCRILCAQREGFFGCAGINERVQKRLKKDHPSCPIPVMITRNSSTPKVRNGDVGVVLPGASKLSLPPDGQGEIRGIPLSLLPDRELAFATTIHKAQGSEFENVILVLPQTEPGSPASMLLTRELLYTALTRTGNGEFFLYANDAAIRRCCECRTRRLTGLV